MNGWMDGLPYIVVRMSMIGYHVKLPFIQQRIFDIERFPAIKLVTGIYIEERESNLDLAIHIILIINDARYKDIY